MHDNHRQMMAGVQDDCSLMCKYISINIRDKLSKWPVFELKTRIAAIKFRHGREYF